MKKKYINKKNYRAFSLIEMILVVGISAVIALAASQTFLSGSKTFEKNKEIQKNLEEGRAAIEIMTKNIRMSKYAAPEGITDTIYFYNTSQKKCISYKFDATSKKLMSQICQPTYDADFQPVGRCTPGLSCITTIGYTNLTDSATDGKFYVITTKRNTSSPVVGRAGIRITTGAGTSSEQVLQTSVSFRDYEGLLQ